MTPLKNVAKALGVTHQRLLNWVTEGRVEPTVRGSPGRGRGHLFSPEDVAALRRRIVVVTPDSLVLRRPS